MTQKVAAMRRDTYCRCFFLFFILSFYKNTMQIESENIAAALGLDKDKAGEAEILVAIKKLAGNKPKAKTAAELKQAGDASLKANKNLQTVFIAEDGECFKTKQDATNYAAGAKLKSEILEVKRS
jgi:hypothetical protein